MGGICQPLQWEPSAAKQAGWHAHAPEEEPQMALDDGRVVFGVPTLLHVLTESGEEMARGSSSTSSSGVYLYELWQVY